MPATIQGYRPDPRIRQTQLAELQRIYGEVVHEQQGAIVFVAGEPGSGRHATLQALRETLREDRSHPTVIAGTLAGGTYRPLAMAQKDYDQALDVLGNLLAVPALFVDPVFGPIVGLLAQLLQLGAVSRPFLQHLAGSHRESADLSVLALKRSLREAAGQHPVVCLLEHIDAAEARFLNSLFLTSAGELVENRPLFIVASLDGPAELGGHEPDEPDALYVARSLVQRGLAHWLPLAPMTPADIAAWLEDVEPRLVTHLARVTAGNPAWLALLWDDLWTREKVQRDPVSDRWRLQPGHALATVGTIQDIIGERLQALLGDDEPTELDDTLYLLAVAALEGSTFTVAALARTLGHDEEEVAEFLDEVLRRSAEQPYGILEEAGHVTIPGIDEERWLWRYRFVSELFWYTLNRYPFAPSRRTTLCHELAGSLEQVYASEVRQVARNLARLFAEGGDAGQAEYYRSMAANVGTVAGWYAEAQLLMAAAKDRWEPADFARAAVTLAETAWETFRAYPFRDTLAIAEAAYTAAQAAPSRHEEARALVTMGATIRSLGDPRLALEFYARALPILHEVGDRAGEAVTLNNMALVYSTTGQPARTLELHTQTLPIMREVGDRIGEATTLNNMAGVCADTGQPAQALELYAQALSIWSKIGDRASEAATLSGMGLVYANKGQPAQALEFHAQALLIAREVQDRAGEATSLNNMAAVYHATGQPQRALELYAQALLLAQEMGNWASEAAILSNMAEVCRDMGQPARALELYAQALPIQREIEDKHGEGATLNGMGLVYTHTGQLPRALELYAQALLIAREIASRGGEASTLGNMATVYHAMGQPQEALEFYAQALPIMREVEDKAGEAVTLSGMAAVCADTGQPAQARTLLDQALPIIREVENKADEAATLAGMGILAHSIGQPAAGFKLMLLGATLHANYGLAAPPWLGEALVIQIQQLGYDDAQLQALRTEMLVAYANDRGDSLIHEAFPQGSL